MRILRGIGKTIGILILSLSLVSAILMLALTGFTEYDNLKSFVSEMFAAQFASIDETQLNQIHTTLLTECEQVESIELTIVEGENITLNCKDIRASNPQDLPSLLGAGVFNNIYYYEYDCEFIECLQQPGEEKLTVLFSSKANLFFKSVQNILWAGVGAGAVLVLVSIERWENRFKTIGITLLFLGVPMLIFWYVKDYFLSSLPTEVALVSPVITQFFGFIINGFLIATIVGIVLTAIGYSLKFFQKKKGKK